MTRKVTPLVTSPKKQKTESFKRPDHPDFLSSSELKKKQFSGVRKNDMVMEWEFWILGEIVKRVHFIQVTADEFALTKAHMEVFYMTPDPELFKRNNDRNKK